ncbi:MAG: hypothetical protein JSR34_09290 [Proteobacteria bacterium]|nr:hypothetical protein [Pseudomonadota bacterium]
MNVSKSRRLALFGAIALGLGFAVSAQAQSVAQDTQRDVNQQQRIEQGLKSGQLSTKEASRLEHGEARIDRTEQRDLRDGSLTSAERAQIQREQNNESKAIYRDKHNDVKGNPDSRSSERMQHDVQRDVNQEKRIHNGVDNGSLTNRETAHLEGREAHVDHEEARAGADGNVNAREQRRIQGTQNRDSKRIYRDKHNRAHR